MGGTWLEREAAIVNTNILLNRVWLLYQENRVMIWLREH